MDTPEVTPKFYPFGVRDMGPVRRRAKRRKHYAHIPCDLYRTTDGVITRCLNRPVRYFPEFSFFGAYLCDGCFEHYAAEAEEARGK